MIDGPFEASGGVVDLLYRAHVLSAYLEDVPGAIEATGVSGDPWIDVLALICRARGREVRWQLGSAEKDGARRRIGPRLALATRRTLGLAARRHSQTEVLLVLTHGRMAQRDSVGALVDRYTTGIASPLRRWFRTYTVSLEPPRGMQAADAAAIIGGSYAPWTAYLSFGEMLSYAQSRDAWRRRLAASSAFALRAAGVELDPVLSRRALDLAGRGLALAELYGRAFARVGQAVAPHTVVTVEGHSNAGRMLGVALSGASLLALQGGIVGPGGETNGGYDQRYLPPHSRGGLEGCPVPDSSLVWGPRYARILRGLGHRPDRVDVIGLPRVISRVQSSGSSVLYLAGANDDLFAFAYGFDEEIATIRLIRRALPSSRRLIVRLHPSHDAARYHRALGAEVTLTRGAGRTLETDLEQSQAVVGKASTTLIEAVLAGVPALVVNFGPTPDIWGLSDVGMLYVDDPVAVPAALDELIGSAPVSMDAIVACTGPTSVQRLIDRVGVSLGSA